MYNEKNVSLVRQLRKATDALQLNMIYQRKFNGISNALEMQVEDGDYDEGVIDCLCAAIQKLCERYKIDPSVLKEPMEKLKTNITKSR